MNGYEFLAWVAGGLLIFGVVVFLVAACWVIRSRNKAVKDFELRTGRKF